VIGKAIFAFYKAPKASPKASFKQMPDTFKKIDKEFTLSDSSVNVYGYRMLSDGYQAAEYLKNPIGYYMHGEMPEQPRSLGVLLRWEDVRTDGDRIVGKPVINLSHPRGQQTVDEVENGFLAGASMGDTVVLDSREDPDPDNPGGTILTLTKWYNKECSLVDMPGNRNAFAAPKLFDQNECEIKNLADFTKSQHKTMKQITLSITPALVAALNLSDNGTNASEKDLTAAIQNLSDRAAQSDTYKAGKEQAEANLAELKTSTVKTQVRNLVDKAVDEKRLTVQLADTFAADYASNPDGLKKVLDGLKPFASIVDGLKTANDKTAERIKNLSDKTWEELDRSKGLEELKTLSPEAYAEKFEAQFGTKPNV
jgi:hypothetical protein